MPQDTRPPLSLSIALLGGGLIVLALALALVKSAWGLPMQTRTRWIIAAIASCSFLLALAGCVLGAMWLFQRLQRRPDAISSDSHEENHPL